MQSPRGVLGLYHLFSYRCSHSKIYSQTTDLGKLVRDWQWMAPVCSKSFWYIPKRIDRSNHHKGHLIECTCHHVLCTCRLSEVWNATFLKRMSGKFNLIKNTIKYILCVDWICFLPELIPSVIVPRKTSSTLVILWTSLNKRNITITGLLEFFRHENTPSSCTGL